MAAVQIAYHWCPHCKDVLPDDTFETFKSHVLKDHGDDKVLIEAVTSNDGWRAED